MWQQSSSTETALPDLVWVLWYPTCIQPKFLTRQRFYFFFNWIKNCVASSAVCEVIFHSDYENLSSLPLMIYVHLPAWRHWYLFYFSKLLDFDCTAVKKGEWEQTQHLPAFHISKTALSAAQEVKMCQALVGLSGKKSTWKQPRILCCCFCLAAVDLQY